jgi:hypothetical protein
MGQKISRFRATGNGETVDHETAFEVTPGSVVTYDIRTSGWWFTQKVEYRTRYSLPITRETQIELRLFKSGSGMCEVRTGEDRVDYHIYGNAQSFAREVERERDRDASR